MDLKYSFAGNLSFTLTGGSFRSRANGQGNNGACAIRINSSNSISDVPAGANVVKAFLYWAGSGAPDYQISLNNQNVFADIDSRHTYTMDANRNFYGASADVTSRISGNGSFTIRDLNIDTSNDYCQTETVLGAWALAVIYEAPSEDFRVVNVYEGFQGFSGDTPNLVLSPSNFKVSNNPSGKHAHITWEGDDSLTAGGENLEFEGNLLFDNNNPIGNQFNSYSNVQDGFTSYGLDVDAYDIDNLLNPGAEQVTTRYSSGQDLVILSAELISVSNVPVADLALTNTTPASVWPTNSQQTINVSVTNNGPANVNAMDTRIRLQLPAGIAFSGSQPAGYNCSQAANTLTCIKQTGFINNTTESVDIALNIGDIDTGNDNLFSASIIASIDHDLANAPDLFDNRSFNNQITITQDIQSYDLSTSVLDLSDKNLGVLVAGDTVTAKLTLNETNNLNVENGSISLDIPSNIVSFSVISEPAGSTVSIVENGGAYGTGQIIVENINFGENQNPELIIDMVIAPDAQADTLVELEALLSLNASAWTIIASPLTITDGSIPASGNKQLYLGTDTSLSRIRPTNTSGVVDVARTSSTAWQLTPALQDELTFSLEDISVELNLSGNGTINFFGTNYPYPATYSLNVRLSGNTQVYAEETLQVELDENTITQTTFNLQNLFNTNSVSVAEGDSLTLTVSNNSNTTGGFFSVNPNEVSIHLLNGINNSLKADGYSAVILNAETVVNVDNIQIWSEPFTDNNNDGNDDSAAQLINNSQPDTQLSIRAQVSDPFGAFDISSASITVVKPDGSIVLNNTAMTELDDFVNDFTTAEKSFESVITLAEENEVTGSWAISVVANEGIEGDVSHTRSQNFMILPFQPNINLTKSITVISDPINGSLSAGNKPKAIPGAEIQYTITAINEGRGQSDDDSIRLQDEIPADAELYIGNIDCPNRGPGSGAGPLCFEDGDTPNESGLVYNFNALDNNSDHLSFSVDGNDFTYEPNDTGDGYDSNIRFIRFTPENALLNASKDGTTQPSFSVRYQVRLK
ncbi:hypothetical protein [Bermanella sp. R86510]|uniref:hypothetical protein n=1 Tax=unclassified Bermanella TaxID=2627862 RepID=UPI0037C63E7C